MPVATFEPKIPIAAITDEFSPILSEAIPLMKEIGMTGAELRVINGKNVLDLTDDELKSARDVLNAAGFPVIAIASPLLKCVFPVAHELDSRY
ncbi:MAG: sugar phosphate isomerase/epimerase, partial [Acidobacteriota bacterium]|nr:sugar phosphate isomerase/epimerase [Acidobacteriota bacterium]